MEYIEEIQEQVILVGVQLDENDNVKESLDELEELCGYCRSPRQWEKLSRTVKICNTSWNSRQDQESIEEVRALMLATDATGVTPVTMNFPRHR